MALSDNKNKIQQLLDGINAPPDAWGGSGASVETCAVSFTDNSFNANRPQPLPRPLQRQGINN